MLTDFTQRFNSACFSYAGLTIRRMKWCIKMDAVWYQKCQNFLSHIAFYRIRCPSIWHSHLARTEKGTFTTKWMIIRFYLKILILYGPGNPSLSNWKLSEKVGVTIIVLPRCVEDYNSLDGLIVDWAVYGLWGLLRCLCDRRKHYPESRISRKIILLTIMNYCHGNRKALFLSGSVFSVFSLQFSLRVE